MAKYQASPFYSVEVNDEKTIQFDFFGKYETADKEEAEVLNGLVPAYVECLESEDEAAKPKPARKSSAK